jgi:rhodanese-related sulfurtransferase
VERLTHLPFLIRGFKLLKIISRTRGITPNSLETSCPFVSYKIKIDFNRKETDMMVVSPNKALEYFETKLEFQIDPNGLNHAIENHEEFNIIDVRDEETFRKGHIPGAINLPKDRWQSFEGLTHDKPNIIYCYSITCMLATKACKQFAHNGYPVMELFGGFEEWQKGKFPVET